MTFKIGMNEIAELLGTSIKTPQVTQLSLTRENPYEHTIRYMNRSGNVRTDHGTIADAMDNCKKNNWFAVMHTDHPVYGDFYLGRVSEGGDRLYL